MIIILMAASMCAGCGEEKQAQKMQKPSQKNQNYIAAGINYLNEQDVPRAIQSFDMAIKTDPTNVENYLVLGQVYMRLKQYDRAIDTFSAAIKVSPDNPEAYYLLSLNSLLDGRFETAEKSAQRSAEIFMLNREEDKLKRSVALLKTISEAKKQQEEAAQ